MVTGSAVLEKTLRELAASAACKADFTYFLKWCKVRSDDPAHPGLIRLQPWDFQLERAAQWQAGASEVILKERQLGFSAVLVAPYLLWRAMFYEWTCGYLSVGQDEAREEISRIKAIHAELPDFLKIPGLIRVDDATFQNGGRIIAFPSTEHAGISYTLQCVVMDEFAFHPYGASNYTAIQPAVARGQVLIMSTADPKLGPSGTFHDMYWAAKNGESPYKAVFEARRRPDRTPEWYASARKAYQGHEDEFDAYYPESDQSAFIARSGLVYPMFSDAIHVRPPTFTLAEARRVVAGVDFGGGDPTAIVILGMDGKQNVHQFAEFYKRGTVGVEEIGKFISQFKVDAVMCDPSQGTSIATLSQSFNIPARKANNRRGDGMGLIAFLLSEQRLTIDPSCKDSINEFHGFRWRESTDPNDRKRYTTKTSVDHHADAMDARRYAVVELLAMLMPHTTMPRSTLSGRPLSRFAI